MNERYQSWRAEIEEVEKLKAEISDLKKESAIHASSHGKLIKAYDSLKKTHEATVGELALEKGKRVVAETSAAEAARKLEAAEFEAVAAFKAGPELEQALKEAEARAVEAFKSGPEAEKMLEDARHKAVVDYINGEEYEQGVMRILGDVKSMAYAEGHLEGQMALRTKVNRRLKDEKFDVFELMDSPKPAFWDINPQDLETVTYLAAQRLRDRPPPNPAEWTGLVEIETTRQASASTLDVPPPAPSDQGQPSEVESAGLPIIPTSEGEEQPTLPVPSAADSAPPEHVLLE